MAQTYSLDRNHTRLEFSAKHLMVSTVRGSFEDFAGTVEIDGDDPTTARGRVTVKTGSLWTGVEMRDNHLRSDDFFGVEKYPEMTFQSTAVEKTGDDTYKVTGDLTIREITRPITLAVEVEGQIIDPWGNERVGLSGRGPMKLISPRKTLMNCGSSSTRSLRIRRPMRVTRGSSSIAHTAPI